VEGGVILLLWSALAGEGRLLTYEDALAAAADNPTLRQAELRLAQTQEDVRSAWGGFDPSLRLDGGWSRSQSLQFQPPFPDPFRSVSESYNVGTTVSAVAPSGTSGTLTGRLLSFRSDIEIDDGTFTQSYFQPDFQLNVSQELLRGVKLAYNLQNVRKAREGFGLAELEVERARQQARADVARAYWTWVHAERASEIARGSVEVATEALRVGGEQVSAGQLAPVERTRLEAALVRSRSDALTADHAVRQAEDTLLLLLGAAPGEQLTPGSAIGDPAELTLDPAKAVDVALSQGLDVAVARARAEAAKLGLADARHNQLPSLTASVNAGFQGGDANGWGSAFELLGGFPSFGVSGAFQVPLGGRAAKGQAERAALELAVQQASVSDVERQVRSQVEQQVRALVSARELVGLADANLRLAEETLAAEDALASVGRSILKDVLEARAAVDAARVEAIRARVDARVAEVELLRLQGQL
jgi:outer membrane protein TolC